MVERAPRVLAVAATLICTAAAAGCQRDDAAEARPPSPSPAAVPPAPAPPPPSDPSVARLSPALAQAVLPGAWRWVVSGGGGAPSSNEASIEEDILYLHRLLLPGGRLLFAGGPGSDGVQVRRPRTATAGGGNGAATGDDVIGQLARIFAPAARRDVIYRKTRLSPDGAASRDLLMATLREALPPPPADGRPASPATDPLFVYLGGHGKQGGRRDENSVLLWGGDDLQVHELVRLLGPPGTRPVRLVATTCHSGGFAEMVFDDADVRRGPAPPDRCGVFATTWDREAGGCDPDPDRRNHDGYSIHFVHALAGRDRHDMPRPEIDLDGDGRISLLEAHTWARIGSGSIDVPTTTAERYLRQLPAKKGASRPAPWPEENRAIEGLTRKLGLARGAQVARARLAELQKELAAAQEEETRASDAESDVFHRLAGQLLARWPALDDPWHPDFHPTVARHRQAIAAFLAQSPDHRELGQAWKRTEVAADRRAELQARLAPVLRLVRAHENLELAGHLAAAGGGAWRHFQALLACERFVPPVSPPAPGPRGQKPAGPR
jgi:hypothetical protein